MNTEERTMSQERFARTLYDAIPEPKASFEECMSTKAWQDALHHTYEAMAWSGPGLTRHPATEYSFATGSSHERNEEDERPA